MSVNIFWCPLTESNCQLMITNQLLYHLTKRALLGGEQEIRTLDTGFGPYAFLAGKCLRPTRPAHQNF